MSVTFSQPRSAYISWSYYITENIFSVTSEYFSIIIRATSAMHWFSWILTQIRLDNGLKWFNYMFSSLWSVFWLSLRLTIFVRSYSVSNSMKMCLTSSFFMLISAYLWTSPYFSCRDLNLRSIHSWTFGVWCLYRKYVGSIESGWSFRENSRRNERSLEDLSSFCFFPWCLQPMAYSKCRSPVLRMVIECKIEI